ncbi:MAG: hypothetical protein GOV00_00145 [Candidatus Altiarchaeota archaeon]|nr:hypothetical protein [Candidatus Altiarchaeota archaeon]
MDTYYVVGDLPTHLLPKGTPIREKLEAEIKGTFQLLREKGAESLIFVGIQERGNRYPIKSTSKLPYGSVYNVNEENEYDFSKYGTDKFYKERDLPIVHETFMKAWLDTGYSSAFVVDAAFLKSAVELIERQGKTVELVDRTYNNPCFKDT